jgi:hypothetical protein
MRHWIFVPFDGIARTFQRRSRLLPQADWQNRIERAVRHENRQIA